MGEQQCKVCGKIHNPDMDHENEGTGSVTAVFRTGDLLMDEHRKRINNYYVIDENIIRRIKRENREYVDRKIENIFVFIFLIVILLLIFFA